MKKTICIVLAIVLLLSFASCGSSKMSERALENAIFNSSIFDFSNYELVSFDIVSRDTSSDTDSVSFTTKLKNSYSERTVSMDVVFKLTDGEWVVDSSELNDRLGNETVLTAKTLTTDTILILAAGYDNYIGSDGVTAYNQMFVEPTDKTSSGYDSIIHSDEYEVLSLDENLDELRATSEIKFNKQNTYFKVTETVSFNYFFDTDSMSWIIDSATVTQSSAETLATAALENTVALSGVSYHLIITGANADGTITGTVDGNDIASSAFAGTRLCGANIIGRPHGDRQVWYYMITGKNLTSMYTRSGTLA